MLLHRGCQMYLLPAVNVSGPGAVQRTELRLAVFLLHRVGDRKIRGTPVHLRPVGGGHRSPGGRAGGGKALRRREALRHEVHHLRLDEDVGIVADAQIRPQSPDPPAAVPIGGGVKVVPLVYAVLPPFPDLLGIVQRLEALLPGSNIFVLQGLGEPVYRKDGAGIIAGIPFPVTVTAMGRHVRHDPCAAGNIEVAAVHIVAVDGIITGLAIFRVVVDLVDPVLHIQRQIQILIRHIPVINGLLYGVVIAEELAAVIDGVIAEDVVAAVIVPQGHYYMTII